MAQVFVMFMSPAKKPYVKPKLETPKFSKMFLSRTYAAKLRSGVEIYRSNRKERAYLIEQQLRAEGISVPDELITRHLGDNLIEVYTRGHGMSLGNILSSLSRKKKIAVVTELVENLARMHSLGIYHGDIHEENVIVDPQKKVRFIDFEYAGHLSKLKGAEDLNVKKLFDDLEEVLVICNYHILPHKALTPKQSFNFLILVIGTYLKHYDDSRFPGLKKKIRDRIVEYLQVKCPKFMKYLK